MTVAARSPSCSALVISSALVDSASPGRKEVDSFFSASEYLPGRFVAIIAPTARIQAARTIHLARRPAGKVSRGAKADDGGQAVGA